MTEQMAKPLEELFELAQQYGNITIFQCHNDRTFIAQITFETIAHATLEASSGHNIETINEALIKAIEKAEEIVQSLKTTTKREYKLLDENENNTIK